MVEERITTTDSTGAPTSHTTVIRDEPRRSGGGATMLLAIALIVPVIAGIYLFSQSTSSEAAKDNAIAGAASSVGDAAEQVGAAAESAAGSVTKD
ncbi:hypothetical protein ABVV53_14075 [Novosphingobium sp. RD2P27]|uniref:Uncharacterized protein n=1 Tax=Novosphingobium kalidii TaxID=3230299 RepID=A0ABV2D3Y5_9SPHN